MKLNNEFAGSNDYQRIILDNNSGGIQIAQLLYDDLGIPNDYIILGVNSVLAEIMGLPREKIIGRKVTDFYPDIEPGWFIKYGEIVKSGKSQSFEMQCEPCGSWHNVLAVPLEGDKFAITSEDVTERREMEEEKQVLFNALQLERDRLTALIQNIPDEVWFTDEYGNIILTNQVTQRKFGSSYLGINAAEIEASLETYHPDGRPRPPEETPLIRASKGEDITNGEEIIRLPVNKELRYRSYNAAPVRDMDNKIIGAVVVTRDVTEQKQMEEVLRESEMKALLLVSELEKADKNKNEFINVLVHELRNPIATITGGIALLKLTDENNKNIKTIKILERQSEHLSKLVDDLLDITRISQNKVIMKKEPVNLNDIARDAIEDRKSQFEEKNIKLLEDICEQPIVVNADSLRITQCVGNILGNALKFTGENGTVDISLSVEGENAVIRVQDNGIGISPEMLTTIFEPFKQDSNPYNSYNNKGLGLGLYIVKEYLEMHNGTVSASSPGVGKGSTFTMKLPIVEKSF